MAETIIISEATRTLQSHRERLADALTRLRLLRGVMDTYWDNYVEYRTIRDDSRASIASTMPVSTDPIWAIVAGRFHKVIEATPDPFGREMRGEFQRINNMIRGLEDAAWTWQRRVWELEAFLERHEPETFRP